MGEKWVLEAEQNDQLINKVVAEKINIRIPEEGEKVLRLVEIAKERNIDYKPSPEAIHQLNDYCDRKGLTNPLGT